MTGHQVGGPHRQWIELPLFLWLYRRIRPKGTSRIAASRD
jgi:hypothetical protein